MAFCAQCGAENKGDYRFCYNCGAPANAAPVSAAPGAAPVPPVQENAGEQQQGYQQAYQQTNYQQSNYQQPNYQQAYQQPERSYVADGDQRTLGVGAVSILAYWSILFFVPLVAYKDSKFARFHAGQGLNILLFGIAYSIVTGILTGIFTAISFGLGAVIGGLLSLGSIFFFVLMIMGIVNVCKGLMKPLPIIGNISIIKL